MFNEASYVIGRQEPGDFPLQVGLELLPQVKEFKCLRVLFMSEGKMEDELDRRIDVSSTMDAIPVRSGEEGAESEAKLSIYQSVYAPTLTYGHELWVMTKRTRSLTQATEMSFC